MLKDSTENQKNCSLKGEKLNYKNSRNPKPQLRRRTYDTDMKPCWKSSAQNR